jgi:capsular exopolysaccharide synthesis family protein
MVDSVGSGDGKGGRVSMDLRFFLDILKRRFLLITIVAAMAISVVTAAGVLTRPVYTASTTVRVHLDVGVVDFLMREDYSMRLLSTYTQVLKSAPILTEAIRRLSPRASSLTVTDLDEKAKVEIVPNTELISITVKDEDPILARDLANTLTRLLVEYAQNEYVGNSKSAQQIVEEQLTSVENEIQAAGSQLAALEAAAGTGAEIDALRRQITSKEDAYDRLLDRYELARLNETLRANSVTPISTATLPLSPSNSLGLTQIGLSIITGLFGGIALALILENLDTCVHSPQQLEHLTHLPVLATVPKGLLSLVTPAHSNGIGKPIEEAYRLLSANLQALKEDFPLRTILVTSPASEEAKSTVAANLAQMLAERGQTAFLVESDLRHPTIQRIFDIDNGRGLSDLLVERTSLSNATLAQVMHPAESSSLFIIGGGPEVSNPTTLLASAAMEKLLGYLSTQGQITLLDAPPVLGMADVSVLGPKVDGVVLVVRQGLSKREQVLGALKQLRASRARVLGFVFLQKSNGDRSYE